MLEYNLYQNEILIRPYVWFYSIKHENAKSIYVYLDEGLKMDEHKDYLDRINIYIIYRKISSKTTRLWNYCLLYQK